MERVHIIHRRHCFARGDSDSGYRPVALAQVGNKYPAVGLHTADGCLCGVSGHNLPHGQAGIGQEVGRGAGSYGWLPAQASTSLSPDGYVRLQGELWRAISVESDIIEEGEDVEVVEVRGLTLLVSTAQDNHEC